MKILKRLSIFFIPLVLSACVKNTLTIDQISEQLNEQGPKNYLNSTINNHKVWFAHVNVLQKGLDNANKSALNVVSKVRAVSDAGASETLNFMVARAIPNNPGIVSESVSKGFRLDGICNIPFIEEEEQIVSNYILKTTTALKIKMKEGDVKAGECLDILESRIAKASY